MPFRKLKPMLAIMAGIFIFGAEQQFAQAQQQLARAEEAWQHLQNPTAAEVAARWIVPPPEYGPEPYYGLNGNVSVPQVERDLDTLHGLGFQAVTVQAGYNMPFAYLSPEYFAFFRKFVLEAKQRNMRVWIVDDAGYPSGFAGGKFTSEKPELRPASGTAPRHSECRRGGSGRRGDSVATSRQLA
jgi:hypothetical protein